MTTEDQLKEALKVAALALEIASDWNVTTVQANPPEDWKLDGRGEDPADGWCGTYELAIKLRELAA